MGMEANELEEELVGLCKCKRIASEKLKELVEGIPEEERSQVVNYRDEVSES